MKMEEIWKDVVGFEGWYSVSSLGRVRREATQRILSACKDKGYLKIVLSKEAVRKTCYVHKLVASAFLGIVPKDKEINHKDMNKSNSCISNLEYISHKDNCNHSIKNGKWYFVKGEANGNSKLNKNKIFDIRELYKKLKSYRKIAKIFEVDTSTIGLIIKGKTWGHI